MQQTLVFILAFFSAIMARADFVHQTLYINGGVFTAVDGVQFPYAAFNSNSTFTATNKQIQVVVGDTIEFEIINNDSITHGFAIQGKTINLIIPEGDTSFAMETFQAGTRAYIYYDHLQFPSQLASGLGGMIYVGKASENVFFWNIRDYMSDWADEHRTNTAVDWSTYYPDYFTINGRSNPQINSDATARITGHIGDTLVLVMANSGIGAHSMHFHGFHLTILYASANEKWIGRSKDTFPIRSMETMILRLVPDKTGEYPVHDHNLVGVSAAGIYPGGMMLTTLIQ